MKLKQIPTIWWQNEVISLECEIAGATSANFFATYVGEKLRNPPAGSTYKIKQQLTKKSGSLFAKDYTVPDTLVLGNYNYQIWSNKGRAKTCCFNGSFQIVAGLTNRNENLEVPDELLKTSLETRLEEVEKAIHNIVKSGVQSYTLSGNSNSRVALNELRKERNYLKTQVNLERCERGLPYLRGTQPHTTYYTL